MDLQGRKYELDKVDIRKVIDGVVKQYKDLTIRIADIQCDGDMLIVEKTVLEAVLNEVLQNAAKHTQNGNVTLSITSKWDESKRLDWLTLSLTDYGEGIPEEEQDFVFNEFYHHDFIHIYRNEDELSLPMCKQILNSCGGDLTFESNPGEYTTFTLELPIYKA